MAGAQHEALWSLQGLHILIVDDFAQVRTMLREMVVSYGATNIESVKNGEEAIEAMQRQKPDVVLCDYNLGDGKDGQQVLEEAREHDLLPYSSMFILVTAENTLSMVMGVVEHEPDAYLTKPFTRIVLQNRIRRLQEKKSHFADVARAAERREYFRACQLCDAAIQDYPQHRFDLLKLKGDALRRSGDHAAAAALYAEVLKEREQPWAQLGLGQALFHQQRYPEAREVFSQAIAVKENFVAAYDWLAKTELALGDAESSEKTLKKAVELSPKNLRRQKALGSIALDNGHPEVALQAYKQAIREGKNSSFGSPSDFAGLARVYLHKEAGTEAAQVLARMRRSYEQPGHAVQLQMAVVEAEVHGGLGDKDASRYATQRARHLMDEHGAELEQALDREGMMSLAQSCMKVGDTAEASALIQKVVRANHEDEAMLTRARAMFAEAGMADQGEALIASEKQSLIKLNNEGVTLARNGDLKASIALLLKAAQALPENVTINLNAAQSMLMLMRHEGANWRLLRQAQEVLSRVGGLASGHERYQKLLVMGQVLERKLTDDTPQAAA